jgi:hypothetical protein
MMLPPNHVTESLIRHLASFYDRLGSEIGDRPLVLPNGTFFPDAFTEDEGSVEKLMRRMQRHAGLEDIPIELRILPPKCADCDGNCACSKGDDATGDAHKCKHESKQSQSSGCGTGACGTCGPEPEQDPAEPRLVDLGDGWRVQIPVPELRHNIALTANLAKTLGLIFLLDTRLPGQVLDEATLDVSCETAGVALGFGGLLLAASYLYTKSCGGPRVAQLTKLNCGELALLTVLFAERGRHKIRELRKLLAVTQVSALDEASELLRNNPALVESLRARPAELSAGNFKLSDGRGLWQRWFKSKPATASFDSASDEFDISELETALATEGSGNRNDRSRTNDSKYDELRNLVDEALAEVTHDS